MSRLATIIVLALGVCLTGCASLNPKDWHMPSFGQKKDKKDRGRDRNVVADPPEVDPPSLSQDPKPPPKGPYNGVLAGQVIDAFNTKRPQAIIQVAATDAKGNEQPIEATANDQGYFTIQGLQPGRRYQLSCRAKRGDVPLAGTTIATPPNAVLLIRVAEELASPPPATPKPVDNANAAGGTETKGTSNGDGQTPAPSAPPRNSMQSYAPKSSPGNRGVASLMPPTPIDGTTIYSSDAQSRPPKPATAPISDAPADNQTPMHPQYQTRDGSVAHGNDEVMLNIAGTGPRRSALGIPQAATATRPASSVRTPLQAPACILTGNRIDDFALNDLQGRPFRLGDHRAKVTLIDFWGTWCGPCVKALPHLVDIQNRYGRDGLQVIGIAYEDGDGAESAERVNFVRQRQGVNYQLLLGDGDNCPLKSKLRIESFPTLILLDDRGEIIFRCEGLNTEKKARLEQEIARRLR